ncbi:hypothetical protein STXM2123_744 [Streptomyces sp. F-3]|nr:hypothetical protein STXM2123_744 [Streptomyces sp. F-3]
MSPWTDPGGRGGDRCGRGTAETGDKPRKEDALPTGGEPVNPCGYSAASFIAR